MQGRRMKATGFSIRLMTKRVGDSGMPHLISCDKAKLPLCFITMRAAVIAVFAWAGLR